LWCVDDSRIVAELKHSQHGRKYGIDEEPRQALELIARTRTQTRVSYRLMANNWIVCG
jgi:hypothetical protein